MNIFVPTILLLITIAITLIVALSITYKSYDIKQFIGNHDTKTASFPNSEFCNEFCLVQCSILPVFTKRDNDFEIRYFCKNMKTFDTNKSLIYSLRYLLLIIPIIIGICFIFRIYSQCRTTRADPPLELT